MPAHVDVAGRPLRAALAYADREGFARIVIVGVEEAADETVRVRDMASGQERTLPLAEVAELARPVDDAMRRAGVPAHAG
jgi:histidyl-tRNA synthetase